MPLESPRVRRSDPQVQRQAYASTRRVVERIERSIDRSRTLFKGECREPGERFLSHQSFREDEGFGTGPGAEDRFAAGRPFSTAPIGIEGCFLGIILLLKGDLRTV